MVCLALALVLTVLFAPIAWAESTEDYYTEQLEESGAADLPEQLPQETQHTLEELGIDGTDWQALTSITPRPYSPLGTIRQTPWCSLSPLYAWKYPDSSRASAPPSASGAFESTPDNLRCPSNVHSAGVPHGAHRRFCRQRRWPVLQGFRSAPPRRQTRTFSPVISLKMRKVRRGYYEVDFVDVCSDPGRGRRE